MRNYAIWCVTVLVFAAVCGPRADAAPPPKEKVKLLPKELSLDMGNGIKLELVLVPAGEFLMGSPDADETAFHSEKPQHPVRITKPFYLGKYPVTQEQWQAVMDKNPSHFKGAKNPVERVNWDECQEFLKRLNEKLVGGKCRLPTEAQWEYACRAGSTTRYCFGDDERQLGDYAWYDANSGRKTHPVGEKKPNAWGLFDMHGNVAQWCTDWWDASYYRNSPPDDPTASSGSAFRVGRGGGWGGGARDCRSADRRTYPPETRSNTLGFRVFSLAPDK